VSAPTRGLLERVVALACRAPSVHNSQPWSWRIVGTDVLELYADHSRQLPVADPTGRNLVISCGAALHHAHEAGRALGLALVLEHVAENTGHDLLARLHFSSGGIPLDAESRLQALDQRCTDRRRFTAWPVPDSRLQKMAEAATGWGAFAVPITDVTARFRTELLMERAMTLQASDPRYDDEQAAWVARSKRDGVPPANAAPTRSGRLDERPNRFVVDVRVASPRLVESSDGLVAICSTDDDQVSWLQAGETLSALWLDATRAGLSVVPLSQVVEMPETREALHRDVFADLALAQLLLRVGWQEIARTSLPRTPRRPLSDVLLR
jgi:nitroreductase